MTVVETLTMYGRLRGIQESEIKNVVKSLMHSLLLDEHAKKQAGELRYLKTEKVIFVIGCCFFFGLWYLDYQLVGIAVAHDHAPAFQYTVQTYQ